MDLVEELAGRTHATVPTESSEVEVWVEQSSDGSWAFRAGIRRGALMYGLRSGEPVMFVRDEDCENGIKRMECILEAYFPELREPIRKSAWERL